MNPGAMRDLPPDPGPSPIRATWDRIEAWLGRNAPGVLESLRPGATEGQIDEAERTLGVTLPADVMESFRIHDGQDGSGLVDGWGLLALEGVVENWKVWKSLVDLDTFEDVRCRPDPGIVEDWWNPRWIPLTEDFSGNHHCLDLAPAPGGSVGQVITMWHDDDWRPLLAPSFSAWLDRFADDLEAGRYADDDEYGFARIEDISP